MTKYTITHNYGQCPNQIHGVTDDGQHFYFRGRGGRWQLHFGNTPDEAITGNGYEGVEERAGWFDKDEWEAFFWAIIHTVEEGKASPLDWERHKKDMDRLLVRLTTPATTEQLAQIHALIKGEQKVIHAHQIEVFGAPCDCGTRHEYCGECSWVEPCEPEGEQK